MTSATQPDEDQDDTPFIINHLGYFAETYVLLMIYGFRQLAR